MNLFVVKSRELHFQSGPSEFTASMVSPARFAMPESRGVGDSESFSGSSGGDRVAISELGIAPEIVKALSSKGIEKLFPIQKDVLEPAMQGRDMIGRARTGTGKTLAFGIPIIDKIIKYKAAHGRGRNPLCLVLAPISSELDLLTSYEMEYMVLVTTYLDCDVKRLQRKRDTASFRLQGIGEKNPKRMKIRRIIARIWQRRRNTKAISCYRI